MSRKLLFILLIPALLLIGAYLYLRFSLQAKIREDEKLTGKVETVDTLGGKKTSATDLRPLLVERMQQLLLKSSNGLYKLSVGDLKLDVLESVVSLQDVAVTIDSVRLEELKKEGLLPANVFNVRFKSFVIEGINIDDALTQKTMDYKLVRLVDPVIHVYRYKPGSKKEENNEDFSQRFLRDMTRLSIEKLEVQGGTIITHNGQNTTNRLNNVEIRLNNILLDSATRTDSQRFLFAKEATINFGNYATQTKDGLYSFKIGKGTITSPQRQAVLQNISFASPLGREAFMKRQKFAKELYGLSLSSVTLQGLDCWTLFNGEELVAESLLASSGKLSVYFDRSLPLKSKMGNFPNQLVAKLPLKMSIGKFTIRNLDFAYTEYNPVSKQNGTISFANITLQGNNLSTTTTQPMRINGSGLFMGEVPVTTVFTFNMRQPKNGGFSAEVSTGKGFEAALMNSFTAPLGMMTMEKGSLQKLTASIKGDQWKADGKITVLYKDLKIALLEKEKDKKALDKKDVTSLLANLFVIKNENPRKGKEPRRETATFQRDPNGGFFMLIWKTILVGALKTMGAPEKLATKKPVPEKE